MNKDELKAKIVEIVLNVEWTGCLGNTYHLSGGRSAANAIADALISAGIGDVKPLEISDASKEQSSINYYCEMREWKDKCRAAEHRAEEAEKLKNQYGRALLNLARRYVVKTNMTLPHGDEPHSRSTDIEMLALYIIANECEQAEKELAEEGKDEK